MKRILAVVLTFAMLLSLCGVATVAETASASADGLVLQDLSYDEVLYRVSQSDAGFTASSTAIYAHKMDQNTAPRNDSGFQFYYISLSAYSGSFDAYEDKEIDGWFLDYLDKTLANLQANGGGCMVRATYGLDGQEKCEPTDFNMLLKHVEQLSGVFSKYPDVISSVECGMIGAFGEMWGGLYSDDTHKAQVLDAWLNYLPYEITVNVRTAGEYYNYVNGSEAFINNYKGKTVSGVTYPSKLVYDNYWKYSFPGEDFCRIGIYNDAMIQDGNDGGTFPYADYDLVNGPIQQNGFFVFVGNQGENANYGGEFSGDTNELYRYKLPYWMPANAIARFAQANLSYYHGGNAAYQICYKKAHTKTFYWLESHKAERERTLIENLNAAGLGMTYSIVKDENSVKVKFPDGTTSEVLTYDEAVELMDTYNAGLAAGADQAQLMYLYTVTTGGWNSATVDSTLFEAIAARKTVTADLDDYLGKSAAKYFEDHVGYRIVLRESKISGMVVPGGTINISGIVDNTGFANITKAKVAELILSDGINTYVLETDIDPRNWKSSQRSTYEATVTLPENMAKGDYSVFLRVANKDINGNTVEKSGVAFANAGDYSYVSPASTYSVGTVVGSSCYDPTLNANRIGSVSVVADMHSIKFVNDDGTLLQSVTVENGVTPEYTGETPVKSEDGRYYEFIGWDKEIVAATEGTTYTATYRKLDINAGDANGDEVLNVLDMTLTAQYISQNGADGKYDLSACYLEMMDVNEDGKIDQKDLNRIAANIRAQ